MSIQLDSRTSAYLDARNVRPSNTSALQAALQTAMADLSSALLTGAPIDPEVVHFVMDYHNDSTTGFADLRKFLYEESPARVDYYLKTLQRPLTEGLTPLIASGLFAPSSATRDYNLYVGLNNGKTRQATPPADALALLAQVATVDPDNNASTNNSITGAAAAKAFAEDYISTSTSGRKPLDMDVMNAYITLGPSAAITFIGAKLSAGNTGYKPLMDVYRQLDPAAWALLAKAHLSGAASTLPLSADNTAMLNELSIIAPQAAADAVYERLKTQMYEAGRPDLDPTLLASLGRSDPQRLAALTTEHLNIGFAPTTKLEDLDVRPNDGIINHGTPALLVDLTAFGRTPQVGDILELYVDGSGLQTSLTLTQAMITAGTARIQIPANKAITGDKVLTATLKDPATGKTASAPPVHVTIDTTGLSVVRAKFEAYDAVYENGWYYNLYRGYIQFDGDIDPDFSLFQIQHVQDTNGDGEIDLWQNLPLSVDGANKRVWFETISPAQIETIGSFPIFFSYMKLSYVVRDTSGNETWNRITADDSTWSFYPVYELTPMPAKETSPVPAGPKATLPLLDHNAYQALKTVDAAAAAAMYKKYNDEGRVGPAPATTGPIAPPPPPPPPMMPKLGADDYKNLSVEALMKKAQTDRALCMADEIKNYVTLIHEYNETMAKLQKLAAEVAALNSLCKTDTAPTTLMKDAKGSADDAAIGLRINELLNTIPGTFKMFDNTNSLGHYNNGLVTYGNLKVAEKRIEAEMSSLTTAQQKAMNDMSIANNQRNEALETLSGFVKKVYDTRTAMR